MGDELLGSIVQTGLFGETSPTSARNETVDFSYLAEPQPLKEAL